MDTVLLIQLRYFFLCQTCFMLAFELFTLFDTSPLQCQLRNTFDRSKKFNVLFIFKVWEP